MISSNGVEFWRFTKKEGFIITPLCIVLSASNLIHTLTVPPWSDPWVNIDSSLQCHPLATGSDIVLYFYALILSFPVRFLFYFLFITSYKNLPFLSFHISLYHIVSYLYVSYLIPSQIDTLIKAHQVRVLCFVQPMPIYHFWTVLCMTRSTCMHT